MNGLLIINKEKDCTSRDVVNSISKILGTKKVGHTGTLDPMATGVLVICVGKCTKLVDMITSDSKEYVAGVKLGVLTDTLDTTGNVLKSESVNFSRDEIVNVLNSMVGSYLQEVPIYSAVKVNGKKLYEYARNGIDVELPKRMVEIKSIELVSDIEYIDGTVNFSIKCLVSKGTYIRSLVRDIASKLGTIGVMSSLERTKQGKFTIDDAYSLNDIENGNYKLIDIGTYFDDMYKVVVDDDLKKDILNGKLLDNVYEYDKILFVDRDNKVLAIYSIYEKDKSKIKPYKMIGE